MSELRISFSYNWNNKLNCKAFTSIRMFNPSKYIEGEIYTVTLKNEVIKKARLIRVKKIKLQELDEFQARTDTGYSQKDCISLIEKMYSKIDFSKTYISLLLFVDIEAK